MNFAAADQIVKAVLYEGYVLYPYRPSSIKNRQRWSFGGIYPAGFAAAGPSAMQTQCLVQGDGATRIEVRVRFLQPMVRTVGELPTPLPLLPDDAEACCRAVDTLQLDGRTYTAWEEAVERVVPLGTATLAELADTPAARDFEFAAHRSREPIVGADGLVRGFVARRQAAVSGRNSLRADEVEPGAWRLTIGIDNTTLAADAGAAAQLGFLSTHVVLGVEAGSFVSLIDPPPALAAAAGACLNRGAWPVLVGPEGSSDTLLCSPIILYDHPRIAPESAGDLFDGTEIDEILTLRILTLTDAEKAEMASSDERARALLERTEAMSEEQMQRLHGVMRDPHGGASHSRPPRLAVLNAGALSLQVGARVRLRPKHGADIIDLALDGQSAVIEGIEIDFEDRVHVAVTVDADPGRDLGMERLPGHRFFFAPDEIEAIVDEAAAT